MLAGCHKSPQFTQSDKVDQNHIFQFYKVQYDAEGEKMTATAVFHIDHRSGECIQLTEPSKVTVNGQELAFNEKGEYTRSIGSYQQVTPFAYTNNDNKQFNNSIITNSIAFNQDNITLNRTKDTRIAIKAEPFTESESVSCMLKNGNETVEIGLSIENGKLIVPSEALDAVQPGTYTARLVRRNYNQQLKSLDRGGEWESQFVSKSKNITIQ